MTMSMSTRVLSRTGGGLVVLLAAWGAGAAELVVGPQQPFAHLAEALAKAQPGDVIAVHPLPAAAPYAQVALNITRPRITLKAVGGRVVLSGKGGDQSGRGAVPRAIVQFSRGAEGGLLEGFELTGAHNASHNGAGVRINQANDVTIRNCVIHHNDMGIMSNGDGTPHAGVNQLIENCLIHSNGDLADPGYNHNLYLGGTSVTLVGCEVHSSLTGHNVKSRAHRTSVLACYIHDSANREFDLVDAQGDTTSPGSDAVLAGNLIVKARNCAGNRGVIHFGQDGGKEHDGTLYLIHNTIVTPFVTPVVTLSSGQARAQFFNNIVWDGGARQPGQQLIAAAHQAGAVHGSHNLLGSNFGEVPGLERTLFPQADLSGWFRNPAQNAYQLRTHGARGRPLPPEIRSALGGELRQYRTPHNSAARPASGQPDLGAFAVQP
jgi:hypothetical protein